MSEQDAKGPGRLAQIGRWLGIKPKDERTTARSTPAPALTPTDSSPITIAAGAGRLDLVPVTRDDLVAVASRWPMGMGFGSPGTPNYLNFQIGEQEAFGLKLQPPDTDEPNAQVWHFRNLVLIAAALPLYLQRQHRGVMLPCAYVRKKNDARFESGFAFFVGPDPTSRLDGLSGAETQYDEELGDGASKMVMDYIQDLIAVSQQLEMPLGQFLGLEHRPRLALGHLSLSFLACGPKVLAVQHPLRKEHMFWEPIVRAGFSKLPYAPMVTAAIPGPPEPSNAWAARVKILSDRLRETYRGARPDIPSN